MTTLVSAFSGAKERLTAHWNSTSKIHSKLIESGFGAKKAISKLIMQATYEEREKELSALVLKTMGKESGAVQAPDDSAEDPDDADPERHKAGVALLPANRGLPKMAPEVSP